MLKHERHRNVGTKTVLQPDDMASGLNMLETNANKLWRMNSPRGT